MTITHQARRRKLTPKGLATRNRIVAAAAQLIFQNGVAETTTEAVCESAGVSASQLYHYFKDKMALVRAVIERQTDNVLGAQRDYLGRLDSIAALRAWRDHLVCFSSSALAKGDVRSGRFHRSCPNFRTKPAVISN